MSFNYINKLIIILSFLILLSCQDILRSNVVINDNIYDQSNIEENQTLDINYYENIEDGIFDFYTNQKIDYDFTSTKLQKIKVVSNLENNDLTYINLIYDGLYLYSLNSEGSILKLNRDTGKIVEEIKLNINNLDYNNPISFNLIENDFIIAFKSGIVIKSTKKGDIIWSYKKTNLLNTPLKINNDHIIILYPEDIVLLSPIDGKVLFEKNYKDGNIVQSNGGQIVNYFNFVYFILPNSRIGLIDSFLYQENLSKFLNIDTKTTLNNLNDNLHIYRNFLVYFDNGNLINTFDIIKNQFVLKNFTFNNIRSYLFYNNSLVVLKKNYIEFYNIQNGNLFFSIEIDKKIKKDSKIIKLITIKNKLHLFFNNGILLILENKKIDKIVDLKIKNINNIYTLNNMLFINTTKGLTYIY